MDTDDDTRLLTGETTSSNDEDHSISTRDLVINENDDSTHRWKPNPVDRFNFVYIVFYLLGVASLLPWNFYTNAKLYFMYKLRTTNITADNDTSSWTNETYYNESQIMFENYIALAALLPNVLFIFINVTVTKLITVKIRVGVALSVIVLMFAFTITLTFVNTDHWQSGFLFVSLFSVVIMNASSAVLQGAICGLAGIFPRRYMQAVMGGMGMGGFIAAVASILAIAVASSRPLLCGFAFFLTAELVTIITLILFFFVYKTEFVKFYLADDNETRERRKYVCATVEDNEDECLIVPHESGVPPAPQYEICHYFIDLLKRLWIEALCAVLLFAVTLSSYPALVSSIQSIYSQRQEAERTLIWARVYFIPVVCFLLFNVTDLIGRTSAGFLHWPTKPLSRYLLLALSVARIVFVPLFMFCNIQPRAHLPVLFNNDCVPILLICVFGVTNGYFATVAMINGPKTVKEEDLETAGSMMGFFMSVGLALGALVSVALRRAV